MNQVVFPFVLVLLLALAMAACGATSDAARIDIADDIDERLTRFAPVEIVADLSDLSTVDRQVLDELVAASRSMGAIFQRQACCANPATLAALQTVSHPKQQAALDYFHIMAGPWDRLDETNFLGGSARPEGAGYYPPDMTRGEFEAWVAAHPEDKAAMEGLLHVVMRAEDGGLKAVPYAEAYRQWLEPASKHLLAAAELTGDASLAKFLRSRAAAFSSDDYYQSDKDWMDLDGMVEVTIGPYEVYEDRLFAYKAAFESFVTVVSKELSEKLSVYKTELPEMERNLPIPDEIKNENRGTESPIRVADLVFSAGDTRAGVQTIAFNLPNDERVREEKGSKKVILRNVMDAKFAKIMKPVALRILDPVHHGELRSEAFFNETLFHELSHGLGPGRIVLNGRETEVRKELEEIYSSCEECKADAMGAYNVLAMIDKGHFPAEFRQPFLVTYFAGLFRSIRFGTASAHGHGAAVQINYYVANGGARFDAESGCYRVDPARLEQLIGRLVRELCILQAAGNKAGTIALFERYGVIGAELRDVLDGLDDIPVDIRPFFTYAGERIE